MLSLAGAQFAALLAAHPSLSRELLRLECARRRRGVAALEAFATRPLEQRFASRLLALARPCGSNTPRGLSIETHLSQELMAQRVGVTRQHVNQLLEVWGSDAQIEQNYGRVLLIDPARLGRIAQAWDCTPRHSMARFAQ